MREQEKKLGKDGQVKEPEPEAEAGEGDAKADAEGEAKRSRTMSLAAVEVPLRSRHATRQRQTYALARRHGLQSPSSSMQRGLRARGLAYGGSAMAAEQAGEFVVVPAKDVRFA